MQVEKCARCGGECGFYGYYFIHDSGDVWCDSCWRDMKRDEHPKDKPLFVEHIPGFAFPSDVRIFNFGSVEELVSKVRKKFSNWFDDGYELCYEDNSIMVHKDETQSWWVLGFVRNFDISSLPKWEYRDGKGRICR